MTTEQQVAKHYSSGKLEQDLFNALKAAGKDIDKLKAEDLSGVDEFHFGWHPSTVELAKDLKLRPGMHVLDVGSGIGGPARYFAEACGCQVTGIDLTQEFVDVANSITRRCGLGDKATFKQGSALDLPFADQSFDAATMIHVGMNIADKARVFKEVKRVLKKGALFGPYDLMRTGEGELAYPMPWAATPSTSFVEAPVTYRRLLEAAGFIVDAEHNRRELGLKLVREMRDKAAKEGPSPLGPHVLMGEEVKVRLGNAFSAVENRVIAPIAIIVHAA